MARALANTHSTVQFLLAYTLAGRTRAIAFAAAHAALVEATRFHQRTRAGALEGLCTGPLFPCLATFAGTIR